MTDKIGIISSDGHVAPASMSDYRDYLDPEYRPAFDESLRRGDLNVVDFMDPDLVDPERIQAYKDRVYDSGAFDAVPDPARRLEVLRAEGIVGEVLFPNGAPFSAGGFGRDLSRYSPQETLAGARAYNRWLADFLSGWPQYGGQAIIEIDDIGAAVSDVYLAKEQGMRGVLLPPISDSRPAYWDEAYEPFWAACEETGLVINTHGGMGLPDYEAAFPAPRKVAFRAMMHEVDFFVHRPFYFLIWAGVFERHPNLKVAFTESHCDWALEVIRRMDFSHKHNNGAKLIPKLPSEYFRNNIWLGASLLSRGDAINYKYYDGDKLMFGADFPHPEGYPPGHTKTHLRMTMAHARLSDEQIHAFLYSTAAEVYGFDLRELAVDIDAYGFALNEVTDPLEVDPASMREHGDALRPTMSPTVF